jgi:hypothetical protein
MNMITYCCYGIYADVGHSEDCKNARPAASPAPAQPARAQADLTDDQVRALRDVIIDNWPPNLKKVAMAAQAVAIRIAAEEFGISAATPAQETADVPPPMPQPRAFTTQIAEGRVLFLPRVSLNTRGMVGLYTSADIMKVNALWQQRIRALSAQPFSDSHRKTLINLLSCCLAWEPQVCVMGNVRAGDAAEALADVLGIGIERPTAQPANHHAGAQADSSEKEQQR